ncbi:MAG: hypothetical protein L0Z48_00265 [candidate division Zixibacteria bacterium]|nr:hypothetical protein [candidate division Zixibacteria bacterium]MCI0594960.1 hypothetical protein [candidate division Zixibacteria bacterium]
MDVFKVRESFWKWGISLTFLIFYLSSMAAILTNEGIYTQAGAVLLGGVILLYFIFKK